MQIPDILICSVNHHTACLQVHSHFLKLSCHLPGLGSGPWVFEIHTILAELLIVLMSSWSLDRPQPFPDHAVHDIHEQRGYSSFQQDALPQCLSLGPVQCCVCTVHTLAEPFVL